MLIFLPREAARRRPSRSADEGATAVEYALLVGLIAVIVVSAVTLLGGNIDAMVDGIASHFGGGANDAS